MKNENEKPLPGTVHDPMYPSPVEGSLAETSFHSNALIVLRENLQDFFAAAGRKDVYVTSNMTLEYEKGVTTSRRDIDLFVVLGISPHPRDSFRVWEEGRWPDTVFEIASDTTHVRDTSETFEAYQRLGIREYFLFDPENRVYDPTLEGYQLEGGRYVPIQPVEGDILPSQRLGLWLVDQGGVLRVIDPATRRIVPTPRERIAKIEAECDKIRKETRLLRLQTEWETLQPAKARIREIEEELRQLRLS